MTNSENTDRVIIIGFIAIIIVIFASMTIAEYLSYLSTKRRFDLIQLSIEKDLSAEYIQGFLNSKK
jgi:hypothetical protein